MRILAPNCRARLFAKRPTSQFMKSAILQAVPSFSHFPNAKQDCQKSENHLEKIDCAESQVFLNGDRMAILNSKSLGVPAF